MKKRKFMAVLFLMFSLMGMGQTDSPAVKQLLSTAQQIDTQFKEFTLKKDYKQAEKSLKDELALLEQFKQLKEDISKYKSMLDNGTAMSYYNLACIYSLQKKKKPAIEAFSKAIAAGYQDYRHATQDTDLDFIRQDKKFITLLSSIKQYDKLEILKRAKNYQREPTNSLPVFTYQSADDSNLKHVREVFKLDSVAGQGDEVSKILRILNYIHNAIRHDGTNYALCEFDAIDIYNYHKSTNKGVNCRHLAIALSEMYLSMGIPSRYVTCLPKDSTDTDCHVINAVYSQQLKKWIWIDPTFNAYVKDEHGNLLGIAEVRERLIDGKPLVLNEDANWNNEFKQTKEQYLETYMAKNLYRIECKKDYYFNPESRYRKTNQQYINLVSVDFDASLYKNKRNADVITHDVEYFWQAPSVTKQ